MVLTTTAGSKVYFVDNDKKCLIDNDGVKWERTPALDRDGKAAYTETRAHVSTVLLTVQDLVRVTKGVHAMTTPTTVEEMRYYSTRLPAKLRRAIDEWPDQRLREILSYADEKGKHPGLVMELDAQKQLEPLEDPLPEARIPTGASPLAPVARKTRGTSSNTPRRRKQEGSLSVAYEGGSVILTPKQLEFMERLSEIPTWSKEKYNGEYIVSIYTEELEDTMNPMSVGAIVTTLREKGLLTTKKVRFEGCKSCSFKLTDTGITVYRTLAGEIKNG